MVINVSKLLDAAGGKADVHAMLCSRGCAVTKKAIDKWISRNSIPSYALCAFILACEKRGIRIDLKNFTNEN